MKKIVLLAAALLLAAASFAQSEYNCQRRRLFEVLPVLSRDIVFLGNSITDGWDNAHPEFFTANNFACRGIGGQVTGQMLCRFRADVINLHPQAVVILAGTNDLAQNTGYISLEHILDNIQSMAELARANGIRPVLCSVLPAGDFPWRPGLEPAQKIVRLNAMIRAYAEREGIPYVDYHTPMAAADGSMIAEYTYDGVHPTEAGYLVMERILPPVVERALSDK